MNHVDVAVRLDAVAARDRAALELQARAFRLTWHDEWYAVAERGGKVSGFLLGVMAQYFKFGLRVMATPDGLTVVRFEKLATGWMAGWLGAVRAENALRRLRDDFAAAFHAAGLLAGVAEA